MWLWLQFFLKSWTGGSFCNKKSDQWGSLPISYQAEQCVKHIRLGTLTLVGSRTDYLPWQGSLWSAVRNTWEKPAKTNMHHKTTTTMVKSQPTTTPILDIKEDNPKENSEPLTNLPKGPKKERPKNLHKTKKSDSPQQFPRSRRRCIWVWWRVWRFSSLFIIR